MEINCETPFFNHCVPDCSLPYEFINFEIDSLVKNRDTLALHNTPIIGDIDGDCIPDIVTLGWVDFLESNIKVINNVTGETMYTFNEPNYYSVPAVGDVDKDGFNEIFVVFSSAWGEMSLMRIDFDPVSKELFKTWETPFKTTNQTSQIFPGIADFDFNGTPEIYAGNTIFDSQSGLELVNGGENNIGEIFFRASTIAADVLKAVECLHCEGLELIAGSQVYTVYIASYTDASLNRMHVEKEIFLNSNKKRDGGTSLVDFDRDGDLDVVVATGITSDELLIIWDIRTERLLGRVTKPFMSNLIPNFVDWISKPAIGNIDDDIWPEIIVHTSRTIVIFDDYVEGGGPNWGTNNASIKSLSPSGDDTAIAGITLFDFNNDQVSEIVFRGEEELKIYNQDLETLSRIQCESGTASEYPVIADINLDGHAEIICSCDERDDTGFLMVGKLVTFQSENNSWSNTRKIWNQYSYFGVNVNDNGTIPVQQQNPHIIGDSVIMNAFLQQQNIKTNQPLPDAELISNEIYCSNDSLFVKSVICNYGDSSLDAVTPVTLYDGDPTNSNPNLLKTYFISREIPADICDTFKLYLDGSFNQNIFVVVNDDGNSPLPYDPSINFPAGHSKECNYINNISQFEWLTVLTPDLNLGPDIEMCQNGTVVLSSTQDYDYYLWHDGSRQPTTTVWESGTYWLEAWNNCSNHVYDTISISIDSSTFFNIEMDTILCQGESIDVELSGFESYNWSPNIGVDCINCASVKLKPDSTTNYTVIVEDEKGCFSVDSIMVRVSAQHFQQIDTSVCSGITVTFDGQELIPGEFNEFEYQNEFGCDSSIIINVIERDTFYFEIDTAICQGSSFFKDGIEVPINSIQYFTYSSQSNCDSTIRISVTALDTFLTVIDTFICEGAGITYEGEEVLIGETKDFNYTSFAGCDSTVSITVQQDMNFSTNTEMDTFICIGSYVEIDAIQIDVNETHTFNFVNQSGCDSIVTINVLPLDTFYNQVDTTICEGDQIEVLGLYLSEEGTYSSVFNAQNSCDSTVVVSLSYFDELIINSEIIPSCSGSDSGGIYLDISGGLFPYVVLLEDSLIVGDKIMNLEAGTYNLVIEDSNGCIEQRILEIPSEGMWVEGEISDIQCPGETLGTYTFNTDISDYQVYLNGQLIESENTITNLDPGTYELVLFDSLGCSFNEYFEISEPEVIAIDLPEDTVVSPGAKYLNSTFDFLIRRTGI